MSKVNLSFYIASELGQKIEDLAAATGRPRSYVVEQALEEYLTRQAWQVAAIKKGIADADAGLLIPHDEIVAWIESLGTPHE